MSFKFGLFEAWNRGKLVGQKTPLKLKKSGLSASGFKSSAECGNWRCSISDRQQAAGLRSAQVESPRCLPRKAGRGTAIVMQRKTSRPVQFEITESTRTALADWIRLSGLASDDFLFPSRVVCRLI